MDVNFTNTGRGMAGPYSSCLGLSLIELIVTLAVSAILMTLAAPSFEHLLKNNRMTTDINAMVGHIYLARSESVKRRLNIIICKSSNLESCDNSANWEDGWIVYADNNGDKLRGSSEPLLKAHQALKEGNTLSLGAFPTPNYIIFYPNGRASSNGTFIFCDQRGENYAKALILWKYGKVRLSGVRADGSPLSCP